MYERDSLLKKRFAVIQTIWVAMVLSVVIYPVLAYIFVTRSVMGGFGQTEVLFVALAAASAVLFLAQLFVRTLLSDGKIFPRIIDNQLTGSTMGSLTEDHLGALMLQEHQSLGVAIWAMGEAPAIFGFVLTFMSGDIRYAVGCAVYSLVNMNVFRPRYNAFESQVKRFQRHLQMREYSV